MSSSVATPIYGVFNGCNCVILKWSRLSELNDASVQWWQDNAAYYNTSELGVDMLSKFKVGECESRETSTTVCKTQQIGPFVSYGAFDWWGFEWTDVLNLPKSGTRSISGHWTGPVSADGSALGFPPIHVHHVHIKPCESGLKYCSGLTRVIEHHGDWEFLESGTKAFGLLYEDAGKLFDTLSIDAELNDARPQGSSALKWWFRISVVLRNASEVHPLSLFKFHGPATPAYHGHSSHLVPTAGDSFLWFSARWPHSGCLLNAIPHAHTKFFQGSLLAAGLPSEVGIEQLLPSLTCCTISEIEKGTGSRLLESMRRILQQKGKLVCSNVALLSYIDGEAYDRAEANDCTWMFTSVDIVTSLWAYGPHKGIEYTDSWFPEHANWFLTYAADDKASYYDTFMYLLQNGVVENGRIWSAHVTLTETTIHSRAAPIVGYLPSERARLVSMVLDYRAPFGLLMFFFLLFTARQRPMVRRSAVLQL